MYSNVLNNESIPWNFSDNNSAEWNNSGESEQHLTGSEEIQFSKKMK